MRFIIPLILSLAASTALAQKEAAKVVSNAVATGIAGEALNGSPVSDVMDVDTYSWLKLQVRLTRGGTATDVGFTCEESDSATTPVWSKITKTSPVDVVTEFAPVFATVASVNWSIRVDVAGFVNVRCTFTGTASGVADTIVVIGRRQRGK